MPEEGKVSELDVPEEELDRPGPDGAQCLMCETFIDWLDDAWPADNRDQMPEFLPRPAGDFLRIHLAQSDPIPFCEFCTKLFMTAMAQFHVERQARQGEKATPLKARVEEKIVRPGIVLPGQPGFKVP